MHEGEVRAAVQAEGLTLVPSNNKTGFKGVSHYGLRFKAQVYHGGVESYLGHFDTALEAALHVARHLGPEASAAAAAPPQPPPPGMSEAEVRAAAQAEGLTLVLWDNTTGFKSVSHNGRRFKAQVYHGGVESYLGHFDTALEAALHVARHLGPEASAAAAAPPQPPPPGMSEAEVRAAAQAEGLTLVLCNGATGFKGVSHRGRRFKATVYRDGAHLYLGMFDTALEAALHVARQLGPEASAAAAAAPPPPPPPGMSEAEVRAAAQAEGLTLVPCDNVTGFKCVSRSGRRFKATVYRDGAPSSYLGTFDTALEAALQYARHLRPEASAAATATQLRPAMVPQPANALGASSSSGMAAPNDESQAEARADFYDHRKRKIEDIYAAALLHQQQVARSN